MSEGCCVPPTPTISHARPVMRIRARCSLTELIEDDERSAGRLVENQRRLLHFDCECGFALHDAVGRADSRHDAVNRREAGRLDRHVAADLREDRQTARAAQKRRLAACREEQREKSACRSRYDPMRAAASVSALTISACLAAQALTHVGAWKAKSSNSK